MLSDRQGVQIRSLGITKDSGSVTHQILVPGDTIEYAVTHEVHYNGGDKLWLKFGTTSTLRPDEDEITGTKRVVDFVHQRAIQAAKEAVDSVKDIDTSTL